MVSSSSGSGNVVVPRLSGFIRQFGRVSARRKHADPVDQDQALQRRRKQKDQQHKGSEQWSSLKKLFKNHKDLNSLRDKVREMYGTENTGPHLIDDASVSLFDLCRKTDRFSVKFYGEVKLLAGPLSSTQAEKILKLVQGLISGLDEDGRAQLETLLAPPENEFNPGESYFGQNVEFRPPVDLEEKIREACQFLSDLRDKNFNSRNELTFDLETTKMREALLKQTAPKEVHNVQWLEDQLRLCYGDETPVGSVSEFSLSLVTMLSSKRSSDDLQTELFDLIGFDRIELIQMMLEHRSEIVQSHSQNKNAMRQEIAQLAAVASNEEALQRPSYGCQIMVQSEGEKRLRKQVRKEEKKINKIMNKGDDEEEDGFEFDPVDLRMKRQAALATAMSKPMFKESRVVAPGAPTEQYPFVFDSQSAAKSSAAFFQSSRLALPSGFTRETIANKCEEVSIPAAAAAPVEIGRNLVPVESLDPIGQAAFQGIKSLNRIQSVVFDTAYKTSENMLVCAPTGAGKTNVAMLTITQTIKQFIVNGVIKKDAFKIVYVAPMKALAAEMAAGFGKRLAPLGLTVRELTGDMQLTKTEIMNTQMLVTTPEKWDVVTRKPGDASLAQLVRLLIIDEVHLLHGDRGPVIETLVARTLRLVESSQTLIRIVGLSATLPNYIDVARFLNVNPYVGLFFFDARFRPVPLAQTFVGVYETKPMQQKVQMDEIAYEKTVSFLRKDKQVMVFVHARNATVKTGLAFKEMAQNRNDLSHFEATDSSQLGLARTAMSKSRNKQLVELFGVGIGFHHAGMLRSDRNMVEKLFSQGLIKVLVCTATLAWGVNLPAHAVIIKGTEIYNAKIGSFVDLGILDVLQIFGRAGRPQFDKSGHGTIITSHDKLATYLQLMTNQFPIESNFINLIADNLNAEISLGTVTNVDEGIIWLSYTYLYVRMKKNPQVYGISWDQLRDDPSLDQKRKDIITDAAKRLDKAKMIRYDERTGFLHPTDLGRTASQFYIKYDTVEVFNEKMKPVMNEADILSMLSQAQEFEQIKVRDDELEELDDLMADNCEVPVAGGSENVHGKVNILIQTHISRGRVNSFSLVSDQNYVVTNATRIARALFEIVLRKNWPLLAGRILKFAKTVEKQMWDFEVALKQHPSVRFEILNKLESRNFTLDRLREMEAKEIGQMLNHPKAGIDVKKAALEIPLVEMEASIQPITRTVLRVNLQVKSNFRWNDRVHGATAEPFWIWVEDPENNHIYHYEYFLLSKKQVKNNETQDVVFTIPIFDPLPTQYYIRALSDRWIGSETYCAISFQHLILPERHPPHTDLLDLTPLPITALDNSRFERLYKFTHFNPIQTQIFHTLYHTEKNALLGAPTGSGKTIAAELAMLKMFRDRPGAKAVYIAPMKALVRERMDDWKVRFTEHLGKKVVELTGDVTPDINAIRESSVIVTTPEKWDGVSRSWQTRNYVKEVALIVIDEIHLLGEDRGPVLEVIVSRTNFISAHTTTKLRIIGLSTALANARDLADWLDIGSGPGLYNFRPSVRPVPLEVHISGFPGKHYCPRMATMNKPTFQAIAQHSPTKPALVFVSSRRQTRITALDLITFLASSDNSKQWLHMGEAEMERLCLTIKDQNLRLTLAFGIGMHHAGLVDRDRRTVEELYVNQKIQVLIATSTVAWGVNFPTHLVVIKGTEYYDGKTKRYVDMPITDVLQMMGRAGRPQYDESGVASVLVHDVKKHFYKKFLYEPFPVESSLHNVLPDHLNAEVVAGTVQSKQEAMDYLTWTYFFRRLIQNPSYYGLEGLDETNVNSFLTRTVDETMATLENSYCVEFDDDGRSLYTTTLGRIASYYYLSHETMRHFHDDLMPNMTIEEVLKALSDCKEYEELPVRHNEDLLNTELAKLCPVELNPFTMDSPHQKAHLLLQSHFSRNPLPCSDYGTDTKSVMDQAIRILQAMIDVSADAGWLSTTLQILTLLQMIIQARWNSDSTLLTLPHMETFIASNLVKNEKIVALPQFIKRYRGKYEDLASLLRRNELEEYQIEEMFEALGRYPMVDIRLSLNGTSGPTRPVDKRPQMQSNSPGGREWITVKKDSEYTLSIFMKRTNSFTQKEGKAFAPKFPKPKDEGWFLVLGSVENGELLALKRAGIYSPNLRQRHRPSKPSQSTTEYDRGPGGGSATHQLTFFTPENTGRVIYTLYIMSDAYLGLDQQYEIALSVEEQEPEEDQYLDLDDDEARFELLRKESEKLMNEMESRS